MGEHSVSAAAAAAAAAAEMMANEEKENNSSASTSFGNGPYNNGSGTSANNTSKFSNCYENFRNVMNILGQVRVPSDGEGQIDGGVAQQGLGESHPPRHFDSYLSKLQNICTAENPDGLLAPDQQKPLYDSVKSSIHNYNALSTRI